LPDRLGRDSCRLFRIFSPCIPGGDLSLVYPIMRGAPRHSALFWPPPCWRTAVLGGWTGSCWCQPECCFWQRMLRDPKAPSRTGLFALINAGVIVGYTLVDAVGARLSGNAFSYTGWMLLLTGVLVFLMSFAFRGRQVHTHLRPMEKVDARGGCTFPPIASRSGP